MANFWLKWGVTGVELGKLNRGTHTEWFCVHPTAEELCLQECSRLHPMAQGSAFLPELQGLFS